MSIIHDTTPDDLLFPDDKGRGWETGQKPREGYGDVASPFPEHLYIPRSEWQARAEDWKRWGLPSKRLRQSGVRIKDQARTNFCWAFSPVYSLEAMRAFQNQVYIPLSPASVACKITNFQNVGGFGDRALRYMTDTGVATTARWPDTAIDRRFDTAENNSMRPMYRVTEWWNLSSGGRLFDAIYSLLLIGVPVSCGYNWWGHQTTALDPLWVDGAPATGNDNSWGEGWGDQGYFVLQGQKMHADDAVAPAVAVASGSGGS